MKVNVHGVELFCEDNGSGYPVLFVHGFPLTGDMWSDTVQRLGGGYRTIVPDLRGMGRSGVDGHVTMAEYADDLDSLLASADIHKQVAVVGLSMGGYIALEFFRRHRNRVGALGLIDTRAAPDTEEGAKNRERTAALVRENGPGVVADSMIEKIFAPEAPAALRDKWHGIMAGMDKQGTAAALVAMAYRPDSRPTLAAIDVPTLVVVGEHDAITPLAEARILHDGIKGSVLEIIPGAGHVPPVEQPDRFTGVLRSFLEGVRGQTLAA